MNITRHHPLVAEATADLGVIYHAIVHRRDLAERSMQLALALEDLSQDRAVQAAWRESAYHEQCRYQVLINREMRHTRPLSKHRASLLRLANDIWQPTLQRTA